jgi:hypothetical protein
LDNDISVLDKNIANSSSVETLSSQTYRVAANEIWLEKSMFHTHCPRHCREI